MRKILSVPIFALIFCAYAFGQGSVCPAISVNGPAAVIQTGESMGFTADVSGIALHKLEYLWSVDKGTIIKGQGTPVITVSTEGLKDTIVTATVEIKGLASGCVNSASEAGVVSGGCSYSLIDDFLKLSVEDEKARLSPLVSELDRYENMIAYIVLYYPPKNGKKNFDDRAARIKNFLIKDNKIPSERVVIIEGGEVPEELTRIFLMPPGVEPPTP